MSIKENVLESKLWLSFSKRFPVSATKLLYRAAMKKKLDLKNPRTLTEKMQWLKLNCYRNNSIVKQCADKYKVRSFIEDRGCSSILNVLYGVWDSVDEIDWDSLPNKFVIKCTHGSGYNYICNNKNDLDKQSLIKKIEGWMRETYGIKYCELIYDKIRPRIIAEKFIETKDGKAPTDYKFFCTDGVPKFLYVMQGNDEIQDYYLANWEWLPVQSAARPNSNNTLKKPDGFSKMLEYAKILSKGLPLVRVDFYCENGTVIFGELTFLTTGGYTKYSPEKYDLLFGEMFPDVRQLASVLNKQNK